MSGFTETQGSTLTFPPSERRFLPAGALPKAGDWTGGWDSPSWACHTHTLPAVFPESSVTAPCVFPVWVAISRRQRLRCWQYPDSVELERHFMFGNFLHPSKSSEEPSHVAQRAAHVWDENWFSFTCSATHTQIQMRGDECPSSLLTSLCPGAAWPGPFLPAVLCGGSQNLLTNH